MINILPISLGLYFFALEYGFNNVLYTFYIIIHQLYRCSRLHKDLQAFHWRNEGKQAKGKQTHNLETSKKTLRQQTIL